VEGGAEADPREAVKRSFGEVHLFKRTRGLFASPDHSGRLVLIERMDGLPSDRTGPLPRLIPTFCSSSASSRAGNDISM
jgi:hypothetical protein